MSAMKRTPLVILIVASLLGFVNCRENKESILCSREGPSCRDCHTLSYCTKNGTGFQYDPAKEFKCPTGWVCDQYRLLCVRNGTCRFNQTVCPRNDLYIEKLIPDPYSCNAFYGCTRTEQNHYPCYKGLAYDPKRTACTRDLLDPTCNDYPALCLKAGQTGTFGDSQISYKCVRGKGETKTLYPRIFFNKGHRTTTVPPPTSEAYPHVCEKEDVLPDDTDCHCYYRCIKIAVDRYEKKHFRCRKGSYFDPLNKHCVFGDCK